MKTNRWIVAAVVLVAGVSAALGVGARLEPKAPYGAKSQGPKVGEDPKCPYPNCN
jgi:hypothetical protein